MDFLASCAAPQEGIPDTLIDFGFMDVGGCAEVEEELIARDRLAASGETIPMDRGNVV